MDIDRLTLNPSAKTLLIPSTGASLELTLCNAIIGHCLVAANIIICCVMRLGSADRQTTPPLIFPFSRHLVTALIPTISNSRLIDSIGLIQEVLSIITSTVFMMSVEVDWILVCTVVVGDFVGGAKLTSVRDL